MAVRGSLIRLLTYLLVLAAAGQAAAERNAAPESASPSAKDRQASHRTAADRHARPPGKGKDQAVTAPVIPPPSNASSSRTVYRDLIEKEAEGSGLSPDIAESVMEVESGFNPGAIGTSGEIGLMQVMPSTARMMGFSQSMSALAEPQTNIHYGVTYLAQAWHLAGGDLCTAVMKYRAGHGETRFSSLSVDYCLAVRSKLRARGIPVFGTVPVVDFMDRGPGRLALTGGGGRCRRGCIGGGVGGHVDFASLNARLTAIVGQVRPAGE